MNRAKMKTHRGETNWVVVLIVAAVVLGALLCGGVCALGGWGLNIMDEQVKTDLQDNPVIVEHIGNLEVVDMDFTKSAAAGGDQTFVFQVKGTKGEGVLTADLVTVDGDQEKVLSGTLRLPSGESYDLFPDGGPPEDPDAGD